MISGCAQKYIIPDKDVPVNAADMPNLKIPLKVGIVLPDENFTLTKTWINPQMQSNSVTQTVPFGKMMSRASQNIYSAVFEQAQIITGKPYPKDIDVIYTPIIKDFVFNFGAGAGLQSTYEVQLYMKSIVTDINDNPLFNDEITAETKYSEATFTEKGFIDAQANLMAMSVNKILLKAVRDIAESREIQLYAEKRSGRNISISQPEAPLLKDTPSAPLPADFASVKAKLKNALEKGAITADQLSRALEESRQNNRSKILDAFIEDKIDATKFGALY